MLYLVWAATPPPQLEEWKSLTAAELNGHVVIRDAATLDQIRKFLANHGISKSNVRRDDDKTRTVLSSDRELFVYLIRLEHH
jgi:hypothetical protein